MTVTAVAVRKGDSSTALQGAGAPHASAMAEALESASMSMHEVREHFQYEMNRERSLRKAAEDKFDELQAKMAYKIGEKSIDSTNVGKDSTNQSSNQTSREEVSLVQAELSASEEMVKALRTRAQDAEQNVESSAAEVLRLKSLLDEQDSALANVKDELSSSQAAGKESAEEVESLKKLLEEQASSMKNQDAAMLDLLERYAEARQSEARDMQSAAEADQQLIESTFSSKLEFILQKLFIEIEATIIHVLTK